MVLLLVACLPMPPDPGLEEVSGRVTASAFESCSRRDLRALSEASRAFKSTGRVKLG